MTHATYNDRQLAAFALAEGLRWLIGDTNGLSLEQHAERIEQVARRTGLTYRQVLRARRVSIAGRQEPVRDRRKVLRLLRIAQALSDPEQTPVIYVQRQD